MASIYDEGRAAAIRLLAPVGSNPDAAGQVVALSYRPAGVYDPATAKPSKPAPVAQTCSGVEKSIDARRVDGTNILQGDVEFVMSPVTTDGADLQLPPITDGQLSADTILTLADGVAWRVVRASAKRPDGLLISVTLQLRI